MNKVLVVDDHPFIRAAVKNLLSGDRFEIVGVVSTGLDAIKLAHELLPDLVVLDLGLPDLDGFEVLQRLKKLKKIKILVLSSELPERFSIRCKQAGAAGYVCKNLELSELSKAARTIMNGGTYFPLTALNSVCEDDVQLEESHRLAKLARRERMVLQQLVGGLDNKQIGDGMFLSNKTISTYKTRLLEKLELTSVIELADFAKRNGVV
jgi:two-component system response regulator EvgA